MTFKIPWKNRRNTINIAIYRDWNHDLSVIIGKSSVMIIEIKNIWSWLQANFTLPEAFLIKPPEESVRN